jgi:hypothetical protein
MACNCWCCCTPVCQFHSLTLVQVVAGSVCFFSGIGSIACFALMAGSDGGFDDRGTASAVSFYLCVALLPVFACSFVACACSECSRNANRDPDDLSSRGSSCHTTPERAAPAVTLDGDRDAKVSEATRLLYAILSRNRSPAGHAMRCAICESRRPVA